MEHVFYIIATGKIIPTGSKVERIVITEDEIEECREDGESDDDVINYILEDSCAEWEQKFCRAIVITPQQYEEMKNK